MAKRLFAAIGVPKRHISAKNQYFSVILTYLLTAILAMAASLVLAEMCRAEPF